MSRKLLIIIIALVLAFSAPVVWWLLKPSTPELIEQPKTNNVTNSTNNGVGQAIIPVATPTPQEISETGLKNTASRFVEIYGSYSSDASFANLKAIGGLVTDNLKQSIQAVMDTAVPPAGFYGVTTKALLANIESQSTESAVVLVKTQRQELFSGQGEVQLRYQDIKVSLVRSNNSWLVDKAEWQ